MIEIHTSSQAMIHSLPFILNLKKASIVAIIGTIGIHQILYSIQCILLKKDYSKKATKSNGKKIKKQKLEKIGEHLKNLNKLKKKIWSWKIGNEKTIEKIKTKLEEFLKKILRNFKELYKI